MIAGFWLCRCKSLEDAIEWLKRCLNPDNDGGEIEIRPGFEADRFGVGWRSIASA